MKKILLIALIFASGCNKSNNNVDDTVKKESACPAYLPMDRQEYQLNFSKSTAPNKVSVIYNGVEKYNSCTNLTSTEPPIVHPYFKDDKTLINVIVQHFGAFPVLPTQADLKVIDLVDCNSPEEIIFNENNIPLSFVSSYVGPKECAIVEKVVKVGIIVN